MNERSIRLTSREDFENHLSSFRTLERKVGEAERLIQDQSLPESSKDFIRDFLERYYLQETKSLTDLEYEDKRESCGLSDGSRYARSADEFYQKAKFLWVGTRRFDKLAYYEIDTYRKADLYLMAGMLPEAIGILEKELGLLDYSWKKSQGFNEKFKDILNDRIKGIRRFSSQVEHERVKQSEMDPIGGGK